MTKSLYRPVYVVFWPFSVQILKIQRKIPRLRSWGGEGQWSMVKDHTFALFDFGTLPLYPLSGVVFTTYHLHRSCATCQPASSSPLEKASSPTTANGTVWTGRGGRGPSTAWPITSTATSWGKTTSLTLALAAQLPTSFRYISLLS